MDGIIIINKPRSYTSHDIVYKVRKIFNCKVGHTGTLDPNATGVLPLLIGKGTLMSKYLINHDKIYDVTLKLGEKRDTADLEGNIIETKEIEIDKLKEENIKSVLSSFLGKQQQYPPMYSAIKVKGKKLYEYARSGQNIDIDPRNIEIYKMNLISIDLKNVEINFRVECSKGTYVRSLCEDIAKKLNTVGFMKDLNRIKVGGFDIKNAIKIDELLNNSKDEQYLKSNIITIEEIFKENDKIHLNNKKLQLFLNGVQLTYKLKEGIYKIYTENKFIGIGTVKNYLLKRDIILD